MIKHVDKDLDRCPVCDKFLKHGDSIHPETWFCTRCNKLVATDDTTETDDKYVKEVCDLFSAEPISGEEFADITSEFDERIMRKFFVQLYKHLGVVGGCDRSTVTIFYTKDDRKKAVQKFVGVNFNNDMVPNNRTIKALIKNGEIGVCPHGRILML